MGKWGRHPQDRVCVGDVYEIAVKDSKRWNGKYRVLSLAVDMVVVENIDTQERDEIRLDFLNTWPRHIS